MGFHQVHGLSFCIGLSGILRQMLGYRSNVFHQLLRPGEDAFVDFLKDIRQAGIACNQIGFIDMPTAKAGALCRCSPDLKFRDNSIHPCFPFSSTLGGPDYFLN